MHSLALPFYDFAFLLSLFLLFLLLGLSQINLDQLQLAVPNRFAATLSNAAIVGSEAQGPAPDCFTSVTILLSDETMPLLDDLSPGDTHATLTALPSALRRCTSNTLIDMPRATLQIEQEAVVDAFASLTLDWPERSLTLKSRFDFNPMFLPNATLQASLLRCAAVGDWQIPTDPACLLLERLELTTGIWTKQLKGVAFEYIYYFDGIVSMAIKQLPTLGLERNSTVIVIDMTRHEATNSPLRFR